MKWYLALQTSGKVKRGDFTVSGSIKTKILFLARQKKIIRNHKPRQRTEQELSLQHESFFWGGAQEAQSGVVVLAQVFFQINANKNGPFAAMFFAEKPHKALLFQRKFFSEKRDQELLLQCKLFQEKSEKNTA